MYDLDEGRYSDTEKVILLAYLYTVLEEYDHNKLYTA